MGVLNQHPKQRGLLPAYELIFIQAIANLEFVLGANPQDH
jgi:hypothetical protein